jgi:CubicO group peptidase (beta-lactamase class C family)
MKAAIVPSESAEETQMKRTTAACYPSFFLALAAVIPLLLIGCSGSTPANGYPDTGLAQPTADAGSPLDSGDSQGDLNTTDSLASNALEEKRPVFEKLLSQINIPGLSVCIIKNAKVQQCAGFGWANVESELAATADTPFLLASVSKTVTAAAVMKLWEDGKFKLDDEISTTLNWSVDNPNTKPITYHQLLTHTAGIKDNWDIMEASFYFDEIDPTISLAELSTGYFRKSGKWYSAKNFLNTAPGAAYKYSNMGTALVGYLGELHAGKDFAKYCNETIFNSLKMTNSSWRLQDFNLNELAMPYEWANGKFAAYGHYTFADYPDGGLRTSAKDLARFLAAISAGGILDGQRILKETTVEEMLREQIGQIEAGQGLIWYKTEGAPAGEEWWGHEGAENGVATRMAFRKKDGLGYVMLMNGDEPDQSAPLDQIRNKLVELAEKI